MDIVQFKPSYHSPRRVSELIYLTDRELFDRFLRDPVDVIEKLLITGDNPYGHEGVMVASEEREVLGAMLHGTADDTGSIHRVCRNLGVSDFIRFTIMELVDSTVTFPLEEDDLYIAALAVSPESRGRGIATALLETAVEMGVEGGFRRLALDVDPGNEAAINLYRKFGFRFRGKREMKLFRRGFHQMELLL